MKKYKNKPIGKFKSALEKLCDEELKKAGLSHAYEKTRHILQNKLSYPSWEKVSRKGKKVYILIENVSRITYTPDFSGTYKGVDWIIETKGKRTSTFNIKWKMFKRLLNEENQNILLFQPSNKTEILESIKIIKDHAEAKEARTKERSNKVPTIKSRGHKQRARRTG